MPRGKAGAGAEPAPGIADTAADGRWLSLRAADGATTALRIADGRPLDGAVIGGCSPAEIARILGQSAVPLAGFLAKAAAPLLADAPGDLRVAIAAHGCADVQRQLLTEYRHQLATSEDQPNGETAEPDA